MSTIVKINGVDKTTLIKFGSLSYNDQINNKVDTARFTIQRHAGQSFIPVINDDFEIWNNLVLEMSGKIVGVTESLDEDNHNLLSYDCTCKDNVQDFDRRIVIERFDNMTVEAIGAQLIADYAPGFTSVNFNCDIFVTTIVFNNMQLSEAIQKLANVTNYSWYIHPTKDVHFFAKNEEVSPFNITDTSANYIYTTLELTTDLSQIKNRVRVTGGEAETNVRTETMSGTGSKKQYPLANKFARKPVVTVGGVTKAVGVEYLDDETLFDVMWDFNQKYLRFKDTTIPASGVDNITATENPLKKIVVQVDDPASIAKYGEYEFSKEMKTIKSTDEAIKLAQAELRAYSDNIREGSFTTYEPGLRSGQTININSALRGINEDYLIQRVTFSQVSATLSKYKVEVATLKTLNLIDILQQLLQKEEVDEGETETLLTFISFTDTATASDLFVSIVSQTGPYTISGDSGVTEAKPAIMDFTTVG